MRDMESSVMSLRITCALQHYALVLARSMRDMERQHRDTTLCSCFLHGAFNKTRSTS